MEIEQSSCCFHWKFTGSVIGWLGIALSVGLIGFFAPALGLFDEKLFIIAVLSLFVLNLVASIIWLIGIMKRKSKIMLVTLFWWAVPLSLWIGFICYIIVKEICDFLNGKKPYLADDLLVHGVTVFCIAYYFVAVYTYKAMKESMKRRSEIPRLDVSYVLPGDSKDLEDAKCLNLLDHA